MLINPPPNMVADISLCWVNELSENISKQCLEYPRYLRFLGGGIPFIEVIDI